MAEQNDINIPGPARTPADLEAEIREKVLPRDSRYELAAYLFIYEALAYTQERLGRSDRELEAAKRHVSGTELLDGIREYASKLFGPLAPTVFHRWGLAATEDFGEIVFNLVEHDLLGKTEGDKREDFAHGFDFDTAFEKPFEANPK